MSDRLAEWKENCPSDLVLAAVGHVRESFDRAQRKCRLVTQALCYAALHGINVASRGATERLPELEQLTSEVGPSVAKKFKALIKHGTLPASLSAYFYVYQESTAVRLKALFRSLLEIGTPHERKISSKPIDWALWQANELTERFSSTPLIDDWLKSCCDKHEFDQDASTEEKVYWKSWRAPRLTLMYPALNAPYEPLKIWDREDETTTSKVLKEYRLLFNLHLRDALKGAAGEAVEELAKQHNPVPLVSTRDDLQRASGTNKRRPPRSKEPCYESAANILRLKPNIDPRTFCLKMDGKAEQSNRSPRHQPPNRWNVRSFLDQYEKRPNTVSAFMTRVRKTLPVE